MFAVEPSPVTVTACFQHANTSQRLGPYTSAVDVFQRRAPGGGRASENEKAGSLQHFLCGLAAGMLAKLGTHPLDVAKKRFQVSVEDR